MKKELMIYGGHFDIDSVKKELEELNIVIASSNFWDDKEQSENVISRANELRDLITSVENLKKQQEDATSVLSLIEESYDEDFYTTLENDVTKLLANLENTEILLLLNGPYDKGNCILEIHSGAGGTEACDWAFMLYRMYTRWCERRGYSYVVLDYQDGEEAGMKSASIKVIGKYAYGYLKNEKGIHRLVRLSPFDANNKRHTSFASIDVTPEFEDVKDIYVDEKDLKIDVYRASGAGGQHVNTTDSAVRITHLPTKIVVTCQSERSQIQNKEHAMMLLKGKLKLLEIEKQNEELSKVKGENKNIEFGSQIRSYVLHPYSMVKDHRTNVETSNVDKVLDGDIDLFIESNLKGVKKS